MGKDWMSISMLVFKYGKLWINMNETQQMEYTNTRTAYHTFSVTHSKALFTFFPGRKVFILQLIKFSTFHFCLLWGTRALLTFHRIGLGHCLLLLGQLSVFVNISANILKPANILKLCHFSSLKAQEKNLESICGQRFLANSSNLTKEVLDGSSVWCAPALSRPYITLGMFCRGGWTCPRNVPAPSRTARLLVSLFWFSVSYLSVRGRE